MCEHADGCSVDLKALKTYQQIFIYITPIITNLGFVNIIVVVVRLRWFSKRFKDLGGLCRPVEGVHKLIRVQRRGSPLRTARAKSRLFLSMPTRGIWRAVSLERR